MELQTIGSCRRIRRLGIPLALVIVLCLAATNVFAQTFNTLASFNGTNGQTPYMSALVQGPDGSFYGTTVVGGTWSLGTVFKITRSGALTTLYNFCSLTNCADGSKPLGGLVLASDGNLYGTTEVGGSGNGGTIYRITPAGKLTTLYSFTAYGGPFAGLIQARDGNFYGTSQGGIVFKMTPAGAVTTLHTFTGTDGIAPRAGLIQATDGNLYGTTFGGGTFSYGTVFRISPAGTFVSLLSFDGTHGSGPWAGLLQAKDGNFYGTTYNGGPNGTGTVFKMTPAGALTILHSFVWTDGGYPKAALIQATDGNLYGTTEQSGLGNVFEITPAGAFTILHTFSGSDGSGPASAVLQATDGSFYGTTENGGDYYDGTVFNLSMNFSPFVSFVHASGKVGATVQILGQGLSGTTQVLFSGTSTSASFNVKSDTYVTATVPAGATTGKVAVTTPAGTLSSNVVFRVTPVLSSFSPASGAVGTQVTINGISLKQASKVTFGGIKAKSINVNSDTKLTATVPTGAKTGRIAIVTPGGTATSTTNFTLN